MPPDWYEVRRRRALDLQHQGWKQQRIAEALGVTKGAVSQWMTKVRTYGARGLRSRPRPGAPPRLTAGQLSLLPRMLADGAEAYGFRGEVWTCARIGQLMEWVFGVTYHKAHVSRLLKRVAWTPQKPLERAAQRDEEQIAYWRTTVWEELKKRPVGSGVRWSLWTKAAFTCCRLWCAPMRRVARRQCCALS
jgi:transposase